MTHSGRQSDFGSAHSNYAHLPKAKIVRREDFTDDLFFLWLEPEVEFTFKPGQYITIGAGGIERPYSIVSAPYECLIELFIEYVLPEHGGKLTPILHAQRVGDVVTMRPRAKGIFTFRPKVRRHVMVATVTGVAPYVSMVRQFLHDRANGMDGLDAYRFFVMEGASHRNEFVYDKEFRRLSDEHPTLIQFVCSVSRPQAERNAGWTGPTGRINLLVEEYLERWKLRQDDTVLYLCGNPLRMRLCWVMLPGEMSVAESSRAIAVLRADGMHVSDIIVNRLTPAPPSACTLCDGRRRSEAEWVNAVSTRWGGQDIGLWALAAREQPPQGIVALRAVARSVFPMRARPPDGMHGGRPHGRRPPRRRTMRCPLPFAHRDQLAC